MNIKIQTWLSDLSDSSKDFEKIKSLKHSFKQNVFEAVARKSNRSTMKSDKLDSFDHKNASVKKCFNSRAEYHSVIYGYSFMQEGADLLQVACFLRSQPVYPREPRE